jgi:hypothetical protein
MHYGEEPDLSQEQMIQDLTEFEFNFIDFATVVSMARGVILDRYRAKSYKELCMAYAQVFGPEDNG